MSVQVWLISSDESEETLLRRVTDIVRAALDDDGMIYEKGETHNKDNSGRHIYLTGIE